MSDTGDRTIRLGEGVLAAKDDTAPAGCCAVLVGAVISPHLLSISLMTAGRNNHPSYALAVVALTLGMWVCL